MTQTLNPTRPVLDVLQAGHPRLQSDLSDRVEATLVLDVAAAHGQVYTQSAADDYQVLAALVEELEACRAPMDAMAIAEAIAILCDNRVRQNDGFLSPTATRLDMEPDQCVDRRLTAP